MSRLPARTALLLALCLAACQASTPAELADERAETAERFMRGLYGGDAAVVDELASPDVVVSYPIFQELFETPAIRGQDAVREFGEGFALRWADARLTVHEAVVEGDRAVLLWSFRASAREGVPGLEPGEEAAWGGITLYRFDEQGRIAAEVGEESTPGPVARLEAGNGAGG